MSRDRRAHAVKTIETDVSSVLRKLQLSNRHPLSAAPNGRRSCSCTRGIALAGWKKAVDANKHDAPCDPPIAGKSRHDFGVVFEPIVSGQAEIAGIADDLLEQFSKRADEIGVEMGDMLADFHDTHCRFRRSPWATWWRRRAGRAC